LISRKPYFFLKPWIVIVLLVLCIPAVCLSYTVNVITVKDGDTIAVIHNGRKETIRFYVIYCSEVTSHTPRPSPKKLSGWLIETQ
jgi:endonuclease YncB( thermonuclease family)